MGRTCQFSPASLASACSSCFSRVLTLFRVGGQSIEQHSTKDNDRARSRTHRSSSAIHLSFSRCVPWRIRSWFLYSFSSPWIFSMGGRSRSCAWRLRMFAWSCIRWVWLSTRLIRCQRGRTRNAGVTLSFSRSFSRSCLRRMSSVDSSLSRSVPRSSGPSAGVGLGYVLTLCARRIVEVCA